MSKYGFVYITTNKLNGMKYIGQCSGDPNSNQVKNYFGSGKAILRALKKNGIQHFSKTIVAYADSLEELNALEKKIILEHDAVKSRNYYNISPGGRASLGFTGKKHTLERNKKLSEKMKGHPVTDIVRKAVSETGKKFARQNFHSEKLKCSYCDVVGYIGNMKRWHFERCKFKPEHTLTSK